MKGLRKILRVSPRAEKTNEWVLNKSWRKEGTVRQRQSKEASILRKQGSCLEKEIMQGTMPGVCRQGRPCTAWMDNIKTWTGLSVEESIRMTEDRDKWRKYVHGVATLISRTAFSEICNSLFSTATKASKEMPWDAIQWKCLQSKLVYLFCLIKPH